MKSKFEMMLADPKGRVGVPILMWLAGAPLVLVAVIWFFFFRG